MARPPTHTNPVKLTLYLETATRNKAQEIAKGRSMSTSALFSLLIAEYDGHHKNIPHVPSLKS